MAEIQELVARAKASDGQDSAGKIGTLLPPIRVPSLEERRTAGLLLDKTASDYESSAVDAVAEEGHLHGRRVELQEKKRAELEALWGEPALAVIFHLHTSFSPDGIFSLGTGDTAGPRLALFLRKLGVAAIYVTDHDAHTREHMRKTLAAIREAEAVPGAPACFTGTELSSSKGHLIVMQRDAKRVGHAPPPGTDPLEIARWAFDNGFDVHIPHPHASAGGVAEMITSALKMPVSLGRKEVEEILGLADEMDRLVYIACKNGTTTNDYRRELVGRGKEPELYARRAVWIAEADAHVAADFPSDWVYFRRSAIVGADGRVSAARIAEAVARQKEADLAAYGEGRGITDGDRLFASYASESDFTLVDKLYFARHFVLEYSRLISVWAAKVLRERKPYRTEAPEPKGEIAAMLRCDGESDPS